MTLSELIKEAEKELQLLGDVEVRIFCGSHADDPVLAQIQGFGLFEHLTDETSGVYLECYECHNDNLPFRLSVLQDRVKRTLIGLRGDTK